MSTLAVYTAIAPVSAIDTVPSAMPKVDGPLMITGYSFSGHSLRYVQVYNSSDSTVDLAGWKLVADWANGTWQSQVLNGIMIPHSKISLADSAVVAHATFNLTSLPLPAEPRLTTIRLIPPSSSNWNEHTVSISINDTTGTSRTPRVASVPETFYFSRNISSSTGNFLTTFTAFLPTLSFTLESDKLYDYPSASQLRIVEVYPNASNCSPSDTSILCQDFVKLYNPSNQSIDLAGYRLRTGYAGQSATSSNTAYISGQLAPGSYAAFPLNLTDSGNWVWLEDTYGIHRYDETVISYPSSSGHEAWAWALNDSNGTWHWTQFPTPSNETNRFSTSNVVNTCDGLRLSEIAANTTSQFIEVYNPNTFPIDVSGCQLQTNRSATANFTFSDGSALAAGEYMALPIEATPLSLTKTTTGTVYVLSSDGSTEVDARYYENLDENTSLALVGGVWQQTFTPTPSEENTYTQYPPCDTGYERNTETGRCNKIEIVVVPKPCLATQYRNPATGRCKNLLTATTSLTACKPGQYRNAQTNRCRSVVTAVSTLKACGPNQERNLQTNRCRKIVKAVNADFPVQAVADASTGTVGWWAFGGVGILAVGYAAWEWRAETVRVLRKAAVFIPSGK